MYNHPFLSKNSKEYRICPICNMIISFNDYRDNMKYWNNEKLFIPCCECYRIIKNLGNALQYKFFYFNKGNYRCVFTINGNDSYYFFIIFKRIIKLLQFGFIDPEFVEMKK